MVFEFWSIIVRPYWRGNGSSDIDIFLIDTPSYMPVYLYQQRIRRAGGDHFVELLKLLAAVQPEEVTQVQIPVHYRVGRYSCHPLISLCATMEKNNRVLNWPPSEMTESRSCHSQKLAEYRTVVNLEVASSGLCHLLRVASYGLCHLMGWPAQDSVVFLHSST